MPLDTELQPIVDLVNSAGEMTPTLDDVQTMRDSIAMLVAAFGEGPEQVEVEGIAIPNGAQPLALRVYRPPATDAAAAARRRGAFVWFHGGGWVVGDLDGYDPVCRDICLLAGVTVISVDYRLAPERTFPIAHDDSFRALCWVAEHAAELGIDPERIAVGGDSAGGHLAAVVARRARDSGGPPLALQVLVYPVADLHGDDELYPSRTQNGAGFILTTDVMEFFRDTYVPEPELRSSPDASPILTKDLSGVAPALVLTAEFDPLRDEGERYAAMLEEAGVHTVCTRYDGAIHMFFQMRTTTIGRRAITQVADALRSALA